MTKTVTVSAAVIINDQGEILLTQRPTGKSMAGLWEFPGGKVEVGETPEDALVRELAEELNLNVNARDLEPLTFASHTYDVFHLLMPLFLCRIWSGEIIPKEGQGMVWVALQDINDYHMPPADKPLIAVLKKLL